MTHEVAPGPRSVDGNWIGLAVSYAFPLIAGGAAGMSLVYLMVRPQWGDQTWLLFAARRILDSGRFVFEDLVEANPPLIVWLSEVPVTIGRALGISLPSALQGCLIVLVVLSVAWSASLLRRGESGDSRFVGWLVPVLLFATVVHPWLHYGQREHIMLLLVLPYLVMAAGRMEGQSPSAAAGILAGLCAAIGFLLKPHHLLVALAVEALLLARGRTIRSLYRPEASAMVATGLGYLGAIWLWAPDYLSKILPLVLGTFYAYHHAELSELISPMRGLKMVIVVLLWATLHRRLAHRALADVLLLAAIGTTIGYVVQLKTHEYHFVPAIAFFDLLLGVIAIDCWLQWAAPRTLPVAIRPAVAGATLMFVATIALCYPMQLARAARGYTDERIAVQRAMSHDIPSGATVVILSTSTESVFEEVLDRGWEWGSRFICLWMLPAIVNAEYAADHDGVVEPAAMRDAALLTRNAVLADLAHWHPNPVLVDRCQDKGIAPCMGSGTLRLDLLQWFERDPRFAAAWTGYVREGRAGPYDLWCRKGEGDVCRRILADLPPVAGIAPR